MAKDPGDGQVIVAALVLAAASPAETPQAFVQRIYASYRNPSYSPFKHPERVFAPRLLAAINEDSRLAHGEVGYLDGDPVCQCQDSSGLKATITKIVLQGRDNARVRVSISLGGYEARPAAFTLVRTKAGWRIADISSPDEDSLLHAIEESNRKARASR
jgi:hypothetical protein